MALRIPAAKQVDSRPGKYNVTQAIFYGRDVGYTVERIDLGEAVAGISATDIRSRMRLQGQFTSDCPRSQATS